MNHKTLLAGMLVGASSVTVSAATPPKLSFDCVPQIKYLVAIASGVSALGLGQDPDGYSAVVDQVKITNLTITDVHDDQGFTEGTLNANVQTTDGYDDPMSGKISMRATRGGCMVKSFTINAEK